MFEKLAIMFCISVQDHKSIRPTSLQFTKNTFQTLQYYNDEEQPKVSAEAPMDCNNQEYWVSMLYKIQNLFIKNSEAIKVIEN